MELSVIIVNYNVRYFLEQCLHSVFQACKDIDCEVFVVDNQSKDDSVHMVRSDFPEVHLIENKENVGFAKANNQAIRQAKGKYIVLLNPDTVVSEDTFQKCIRFYTAKPNAGILGVRMIDGSGRYLPESKRGIPTPLTSFFKMSGLYRLFPKSSFINKYYLGHLSEKKNQQIEVVAGAFMFASKEHIEAVGLLDESFFMYGEDIDWSYRFMQNGYDNYYLAETTIIHYKGESTKKTSLNYVKIFYNAMLIFAKKHFSGGRSAFFTLAIKLAILFQGTLSILKQTLQRLFLPILDIVLIALGLVVLKDFWASYYFNDPQYYTSAFLRTNVPLYTGVWILAIFLSGGYDNYQNIRQLIRGVFIGSLILAAIYGFLDLTLRTSRMLIVLGSIWTLIGTLLVRYIIHFTKTGNLKPGRSKNKQLVIVSSENAGERIRNMILRSGIDHNFVGFVSPGHDMYGGAIGTFSSLEDMMHIYDLEEVVVNAAELRADEIMSAMAKLGSQLHFKLVTSEGTGIIGSKSKNEPGELYTMDIAFNLNDVYHRRNKWIFDRLAALIYLILWPFSAFFSKTPFRALTRAIRVLFGSLTWVGYHIEADFTSLPRIKRGVLNPLSGKKVANPGKGMLRQINVLYAKDYSISKDFDIVVRNWRRIGNESMYV